MKSESKEPGFADSGRIKATPHNSGVRIAQTDFSTNETKSAGNTLCVAEHFCEICRHHMQTRRASRIRAADKV